MIESVEMGSLLAKTLKRPLQTRHVERLFAVAGGHTEVPVAALVDKIIDLHQQFHDRVKLSFGWGTLLTNDFRGLTDGDALAPFSLVCKAVAANGKPTVKLSDNPRKAMGPEDEIARYKRVFGVGEQEAMEVVV